MLTTTRDVMLPTSVTGSWPRPRWYTMGLNGQALSRRMTDSAFREQFTDAVSVVISDQERAGLDILSNGDYHQDPDLAGRSWWHYPAERWSGLSTDTSSAAEGGVFGYAPGTLVNEIFTGWRTPEVLAKPSRREPLEFAKIWRIAQSRTTRPVRFGTISAQTLAELVRIDEAAYGGDRQELILDMAALLNAELRDLAAAGCQAIQVEEPSIHTVAAKPDSTDDVLDLLIDSFNKEVEGLGNVEVWAHTCWGNPNMQKVYDYTSYEKSAEIFLTRLNIDVWTVEAKSDDMAALPIIGQFRESMRPKVALGVISHRTLQVESPEEVAVDIRRALEYIKPEKLVLTSDCGFGREGANRNVAFYKAAALAQGANIVRKELGFPQTPVPAADPALQADIPEGADKG